MMQNPNLCTEQEKKYFEMLCAAFANNDVVLMKALENKTGLRRAIICIIQDGNTLIPVIEVPQEDLRRCYAPCCDKNEMIRHKEPPQLDDDDALEA